MSDDKTMEYTNGEITVVWKPDVCIHAGECVKGSPEVFKPKERPWIQIERSSTERIMSTIDNCPSGALSYRVEKKEEEDSSGEAEVESGAFRIKATKNGPFLAFGDIELEDGDGNVKLCKGRNIALCRCGASTTKPFCDGSHSKVNFWG